MCEAATKWAWGQTIKPASTKLALLCLARHATGSGECSHSVSDISKETGLNRKTVMSALASLQGFGLLSLEKTKGATSQYVLLTSTENGTTTSAEIGTSPENGTGTENGTTWEAKPVPKTVPVEQNQYRKRHRSEAISDNRYINKDNKYKYTSEHMQCAEWIFNRVCAVTESNKPANLPAWADHIRKLNEIDGRDLKLICQVFDFANNDPFWRTNILSTAKLREKFDALFAKSKEATNAANRPKGNPSEAGQKLTPAQRTAAKRNALRQSQSSDMGTVATHGGDVRPPVGLPTR